MINDVSRALTRWLQGLTGFRTTGSYVNGRWVDGTPSNFSFQGVVQNASPDDLQVLPEGNRSDEVIKIHTLYDLVCNISDDTKSDLVNYNGTQYRVNNVAYRHIGNYNKALAIRV